MVYAYPFKRQTKRQIYPNEAIDEFERSEPLVMRRKDEELAGLWPVKKHGVARERPVNF